MPEDRDREGDESTVSERLTRAQGKGEGLTTEFIGLWQPQQQQELAKEVAALATMAGGTIYLGVTDDGEVRGQPIDEALTAAKGREELLKAIRRAVTAHVHPAVMLGVAFCEHPEGRIVEISVPSGREPVYYLDGKPYWRNQDSSQPAPPEVVKDLHQRYFQEHALAAPSPARAGDEQLAQRQLLFDAGVLAHEVMAEWATHPHRQLSPHLTTLQYTLESLGDEAGRLASSIEPETAVELREALGDLRSALRTAGEHEWYLGKQCWDDWVGKGSAAAECARHLLRIASADLSLAEPERQQIRKGAREACAELITTWEQHRDTPPGPRLDRVQSDVGHLGRVLARLAGMLELTGDEAVSRSVDDIAITLRRMEAEEFYGGEASWKAFVERGDYAVSAAKTAMRALP